MDAKWTKKGLIFQPTGKGGWMNSHAQVPTPLVCDDVLRVYFASRPNPRLSLTGYVDLNPEDPSEIVYVHESPILDPGKPGTFDEFGIMPACAVEHGGLIYLYYSGWSRCASVPYHNTTGLAVSEDSGRTFRKLGEGPILERTLLEPYSATNPFVLKADDGWWMWYSSGTGWIELDGRWEHVYDVKCARSEDGVWWTRDGSSAIAQTHSEEAITRACVLDLHGQYLMWYCYRGSRDFRDGADSYRIGCAYSTDLVHWTRQDDRSGIVCGTPGEPDSEMVAYPYVFRANQRIFMLYNGDRFGTRGFCLAEGEKG